MPDGAPFLEFFAGAGLVRLGLEPGFRCVFANDICPKKAAVYRLNFGGRELRVGDIAGLAARDLPDATLAWASFPCQDLSLAGWRRGMSPGERSGAFWSFWRLLRDLAVEGRRPPLVAVENVVGLLHGDAFAGLVEALAALGLRVGAMVIDARLFVPQSRPRVFVVAADAALDLDGLSHPDPADWTTPPALRRAVETLPARARQAWVWWDLAPPAAPPAPIAELLDAAPATPAFEPREVERLRRMMSATHAAKLSAALANGRSVGFLYRRTRAGRQRAEVRFDGVAGCLRTPEGGSSRQTVVDVDEGRIRMRLLTAREAARLMGAPESYRLPAGYNDAYRAMGDGVAVPVVRRLAEGLLQPLSARLQPTTATAGARGRCG